LTVDNIIKGLFSSAIDYDDLPENIQNKVDEEMEKRNKIRKFKIECPYCGKRQIQQPLKSWNYLKTVKVSRYQCSCKEFFQYYQGQKSTWTIPKRK
jgi:hypothetical protein